MRSSWEDLLRSRRVYKSTRRRRDCALTKNYCTHIKRQTNLCLKDYSVPPIQHNTLIFAPSPSPLLFFSLDFPLSLRAFSKFRHELGVSDQNRRRRREGGGFQVEAEVGRALWPCSIGFLTLHPLSSRQIHRWVCCFRLQFFHHHLFLEAYF